MDYHDHEMVEWRHEVLGKAEMFCQSNILSATPPKFRYWCWYLVLGGGTVAALVLSVLLNNHCIWFSNMFGNIAAGLIASIVLLLFTNARERNLSYYDHMTPELSQTIQCLNNAFMKLYWEQNELRKDKRTFAVDDSQFPILENYRIFSMKVYLTHKTLLDLYRQVLAADKLDYKPLQYDLSALEEYECKVEEFEKTIAVDYSEKRIGRFDEYDTMYFPLGEMEMELMRYLKAYISEMQKNIYFVRFGKKQK